MACTPAGAVAHLVVKGAVAALPRSLALRQRLLQVVSAFSFPGMQGLREALLQGIAADFSDRWVRSGLACVRVCVFGERCCRGLLRLTANRQCVCED